MRTWVTARSSAVILPWAEALSGHRCGFRLKQMPWVRYSISAVVSGYDTLHPVQCLGLKSPQKCSALWHRIVVCFSSATNPASCFSSQRCVCHGNEMWIATLMTAFHQHRCFFICQHHQIIQQYMVTFENLLFTAELDHHILAVFQQFCALQAWGVFLGEVLFAGL